MDAIKPAIITAIAALAFIAPNIVHAENHRSESPSFKSTQLTDNIFMLQGKGGNLALLQGTQGLVLVDADYEEMSDALESELAKHGGIEKVAYLINTHWHGDHTQGNDALGHHAQIIAHENVRPRLLTAQEIELFGMVSDPYPAHAVPSITYETSMSLHIDEEHIEVVHFSNGHTDGDSIVFFKTSNIVHMGDHLFSGFFPFVDVAHGGDVLKMAENIKAVLAMVNNETKIIPGHGPLSEKADLQDFHDMLIGTSAEIKAMKEEGMPLEEIKAKGLSETWKQWADGFIPADVWIGIVHDSLRESNGQTR